MTYQLRVVPIKKRRGKRDRRMSRIGNHIRFSDIWLGLPLMEDRLFGNLSFAVRSGLEGISSPATDPRGAILFVEGDKPEGVFVLRSGRVRLSASSVDGKSLIVRRAEPGGVVWLAPPLRGEPMSSLRRP